MNSGACAAPERISGVVIHEPPGTDVRWIVETPDGKTVRLGADVGRLYACLDGASTPDVLATRMGEPWTPDAVNAGIERLRECGLIMGDSLPEGRESRRIRIPSLASMQVTLLDHPSIFSGCRRWMRAIVNRWSVATAMSVGVIGAATLLVDPAKLLGDLSSPVELLTALWLLVSIAVFTSLHEFGHAIALARFGGRVRRIGVMLFYLSPAMFCDVSDAWRLPHKRQRVIVALAGGLVSFALAGCCAILYSMTPSSSPVLATLAVASYAAVVFNLLPFVKLDGYIALMTYLDIPGLRQVAMDEWKRALLNLVFRDVSGVRNSATPWVVWYGFGCSVMPFALLASVAAQFGSLAAGLGVTGLVLRSAIWLSVVVIVFRGAWRIRILSEGLGIGRWRWRALAASMALVTVCLSFIPVSTWVDTGYATLTDGTSYVIVPPGCRADVLTGRSVTLFKSGLMLRVQVGEAVASRDSRLVSLPLQATTPVLDNNEDALPLPAIRLEVAEALGADAGIGVARIQLGTVPIYSWMWRTIVLEPVNALLR